jgi:hypothetical protein
MKPGNKKYFFYKALVITVFFFVCDHFLFQVLYSGMIHYFNFDKKAEILCIGHSHTVLGIDERQLEKQLQRPVTKYAIAGANCLDRYWMIKHYLSIDPDVSIVVYDVDPRIFDTEGLSSASYTLFLPFIDNPVMAEYLHDSSTWQEFYSSKFIRTSRFRDQSLMIALRGLFDRKGSSDTRQLRIEDHAAYLEKEQKRKVLINQESVEIFLKTIKELTQRDIQVVLLYVPVTDVMNQIDPPKQQEVKDFFEFIANENTNVFYWDYNQENEHRYDFFRDLRHLNDAGKEYITKKLAHDLKKL